MALALSWPLASQAETFDKIEAETVRAADQALKQTESVATSVSFAFDYLAAFVGEAGPPPAVIQAELQATTERLEGVRSVLIVGKDGTLLYDSFTDPAPAVNLGNRKYVRDALEKPGLQISETVMGRSSGFPFVPMAAYKPSIDAVLTAITDVRKLKEPLDWCFNTCGGVILSSAGEIIVSSPPEITISEETIAGIIGHEDDRGTFIQESGNISILFAFRKSERFPFIVLASRAFAPTGSVATE